METHQDEIFLHDRLTHQTRKLSRTPFPRVPAFGYSADPAISADGTTVVFSSTATNVVFGEVPQEQEWREYIDQQIYGTQPDHSRRHVYVVDVASEKIWRLSSMPDGTPSSGSSALGSEHAISPDGRIVVFSSTGTDLGPDDANTVVDLYLVDRGVCENGPERGDLSEVVDGSVERRAGPAAWAVDQANCSLLVPNGL